MLWSEKIQAIVQLEPLMVLCGLVVVSCLVYKLVLRDLTEDRHRLLRQLFKNLFAHWIALGVLFALFRVAWHVSEGESTLAAIIETRLLPYVGFLVIVWGAIVFIKTARVFAFEYLFLTSMKAGVPTLLVNILSLALFLAIGSWIAIEVFSIRLVPVLTTSALISVILGLALQDTLGNLFAGIALQFDKPYIIGDWVEVNYSGEKWIGQVQEITWRSTVLIGILDELITIPNRLVGQSEVVAWGAGGRPFWRGLSYRIPFNQSIEPVRQTLLRTVASVAGVRKAPAPRVYLNEIGDSWLNFRVIFTLDNYASQFRIVDLINTAVMEALLQNKIPVATPAMRVEMMEEK